MTGNGGRAGGFFSPDSPSGSEPSTVRRALLAGTAAIGIGALLAGCDKDDAANAQPARLGDTTAEEASIQQLLSDRVAALQAKDIDKIMSFDAPDIVVFDMPTPLQYVGNDEYRKSVVSWLDSFQGSPAFETHDLHITVGTDVAFTHSLFRVTGTLTPGPELEHWVRITYCLRKVDGRWQITHEHVSLPIDLATDKAVHYRQP